MAGTEDITNTTAQVVRTLDQVYDALDAIVVMARCILDGQQDAISLAKGINLISSEAIASVDEFREQIQREEAVA